MYVCMYACMNTCMCIYCGQGRGGGCGRGMNTIYEHVLIYACRCVYLYIYMEYVCMFERMYIFFYIFIHV
jgi:hypothetical protein